MGFLNQIAPFLLDTTVNLSRRTVTLSSIGAPVETWTVRVAGERASVQPISVQELSQLTQGVEYPSTHRCFIQATIAVAPLNGDRITDIATGQVYNVDSVIRHKARRIDTPTSHHYTLEMSIPRTAKS